MTINLCFHGIGTLEREREPGERRYWVTEDTFHRILDRVPADADVALSFDDGNRSDADIALPSLLERGMHATFFALAGRLDDAASLSPEDLRTMRAAGMTIGCHGWDHVPWRGLSAPQARRELVESRRVLEEAADTRITQAALPLGRYDRQALRRLKQAGYRAVFTSDRFPANDSAWLRPRYSVTATDTAESVAAVIAARRGIGDAVRLGKSLIKRLR